MNRAFWCLAFGFGSMFANGVAAPAAPVVPAPAGVLNVMERVADWQLAHSPADRPRDGWVQAAGYTGIMALSGISKSPRFEEAMMKMGAENQWKPAGRVYHADDHCVLQTYIELYTRHPDKAMLAPAIARFDAILAAPTPVGNEFKAPDRVINYWWCDALYMGPPAWVGLWKATGKAAYLDFALENWWKTSDFLYDREEHLYFRDATYFAKRESNGRKIFWSRGNGWVVGGLVHVLQLLPSGHPARAKFEQQFREMMATLVTLQAEDGFWRSSLLDPAEYPAQEASGTGFFCYGLLWGVNEGLLDRATYLPAALKGWAALNTCVQPDGKLIHIQPIGADPKKFDENSTEPYGVGSFLLAGSELFRVRSL
ncbi:MAG: Unsaturated rhamnogalacturonyl hydrolase YteR [Verrucomicrobiota bacterium]|jgi:rhamnogalacturonyl hydrolase YesR